MIKDFNSQKLPRFKAGEALLDQVTAERLNDICSMIEASRLQTGVGYMLTRTQHGTTLNIAESEYSRPPKLWRVGLDDVVLDPVKIISEVFKWVTDEILNIVGDPSQFTSIFQNVLSSLIDSFRTGNAGSASGIKSLIENIINPIKGIIDQVDSKVEELLNKVVPIQTSLEHYFNSRKKRPRSGDMIYTDEFGICYTIYKEQEDEEGFYPTQNLIFRVPFTLGSGENAQTYFALTTFPVPDIAEIIKTILDMVSKFISSLLGASLEGLVQAILNTVSKALNALYEFLFELIEQIKEMIQALWDAINGILNSISNLDDLIADLNKDIFGDEKEGIEGLSDKLSSLDDKLNGEEGILAKFQEILDSLVDINWITANGGAVAGKVPVFDARVLAEQPKQAITWIDSDTGQGVRGEALIWNKVMPNVKDVDWRPIKYVGADGKSYQNKFLVHLPELQNQQPTGEIEPLTVEVCEEGTNTTKTILEKKK